MIFTLNADFSQKNIGKITIPEEISYLTKSVMSHYTKELTESRVYALNSLLNTLNRTGIYDKITNMWIPCISSTTKEALYNVKTNVAGVESQITTFSLNDYGLLDDPTSVSSYTSRTAQPMSESALTNRTIVTLAQVNDITKDAALFIAGSLENSVHSQGYYAVGITGNQLRFKNWPTLIPTMSQLYTIGVHTIGKTINDLSNVIAKVNGNVVSLESSGFTTKTLTEATSCFISARGLSGVDYNANPISLVVVANGLTESENTTLNDAIETFKSAFFVE